MNCHEAQRHLFAAQDGALDNSQRAALEAHVAHCADCQRIRDNLSAALTTWRQSHATTPVPDAEREWQAVRRRMRGGVTAGSTRTVRPSRSLFTWLALPLGAAAALAVALFVSPLGPGKDRPAGGAAGTQVARADDVEAPGNASTMVFVDDKSGWLFVVASDYGSKSI